MKLVFFVSVLIKLLTSLVHGNFGPIQQSSFLRVLKNKFFKHSNIIKINEVHTTKCLAICNIEERCDSVNYNESSKTCVVHLGVDEVSRNNDEMMTDENGWVYYEKDKDLNKNIVSYRGISLRMELRVLELPLLTL